MVYIATNPKDTFNLDIFEPYENPGELILPCPYFRHQFGGCDDIHNSLPNKLNFATILLFKVKDRAKQDRCVSLLNRLIEREMQKKLILNDNEDYYAQNDESDIDIIYKDYDSLYDFVFMSGSYFTEEE